MSNLKEMIWNEQFRPNSVKEVISPYSITIQKYLENPKAMPNLLFHSTIGGTGKSSMAKAIVKDLGCDVLVMNASADRGIDNIRNTVKSFARTKSSKPGLKKCVFMDEIEKLTKDSLDALKNMIEEYSQNCFYIGTTNNISKINQPMQSRFVCYEFTKPDKHDVYTYLEMICTKKGLQYEEEALMKLIDINYPSIRKCVNYLQDLAAQEKSATTKNIMSSDEEFKKIWLQIKNKKFVEVKTYIFENGTDCVMLNRWIFNNLFNEQFELKVLIKLVQLTGRNEKDTSSAADDKIVFISSLPEIMAVL